MQLNHWWRILCSAAWLGMSREKPEVKILLRPLDHSWRERCTLEHAWLLEYVGDKDE